MRQKRAKAYRRLMDSYRLAFGFRQPYQVLLDAEFCESIAKSGIDVEKQLETVLQGKTKPMITQCCITELYNLGREGQNVVDMAKQFERRKCNHREAIPGVECLTSVIGLTNQHRYVLATQSTALRNHLRSNVPGAPIMHVKRGVTVMEPMSDVTLKKKDEMESSVRAPTAASTVLPPSGSTSSTVIPPPPPPTPEPPKKKGPKAPNPLSIKKKKAKGPAQPPPKKKKMPASEASAAVGSKRRRGEDEEGEEDEGGESKGREESLKVDVIGGEGGDGSSGRKKKRRRKRKAGPAASDDDDEAVGPGGGESGEESE